MKKDLQRPMLLILQRCRSQWRLGWQRFEAVLPRHSRCCRDPGWSWKQPCCRNWVGLRKWEPLPEVWQGLRLHQEGSLWDGLQQGLQKQCSGRVKLQRACGQLSQFHQLLTDLWLWDTQRCQVALLWHSRCFQDRDSRLGSLGGQNLMGLREWKLRLRFGMALGFSSQIVMGVDSERASLSGPRAGHNFEDLGGN